MRAAILGATLATAVADDSKCYALALSGGGDQLAWVAGVVQGLVEHMDATPEERQWRVITGMSSGAVLASLAASFELGDEISLGQYLVDTVSTNLTNTPGPARVFEPWPAGVDPKAQSGLHNNSVLSETLAKLLAGREPTDRMFSIGALDLGMGELTLWDESLVTSSKTKGLEYLAEHIKAAMSKPGTDETVSIDNTVYSSGSVILGTDVFSAVLKCEDAGYAHADIVVDVVTSDSTTLGAWNPVTGDFTVPLLTRGTAVQSFNQQMSDIFDACDAYPEVSWRYFVQPSSTLPSDGTSYNGTVMREMVQQGISDAKTASSGKQCDIANSYRHSRAVPGKLGAEKRNVDAEDCKVMVLSGGGAKGAYEAGVIRGMVSKLDPTEVQWQIFTGISAGSILTSAAALFDVGQEEAMAKFMVESNLNFSNTNSKVGNVYISWPSIGQSFIETGLYDTEPLFNTLQETIATKGSLGNRKFVVGATDDLTGELKVWDETDVIGSDGELNITKMATYVRASAAVPGAFESVKIGGTVYSDGGSVMGSNIFSAVNRCKQSGYAESDIVLDLVTCNSNILAPFNATANNKAAQILARSDDITSFSKAMADIFDACDAYPLVNWRYYVPAPANLNGSSMTFDKDHLEAMAQQGIEVASKLNATGTQCVEAEKQRKSKLVPQVRPRHDRPVIV